MLTCSDCSHYVECLETVLLVIYVNCGQTNCLNFISKGSTGAEFAVANIFFVIFIPRLIHVSMIE